MPSCGRSSQRNWHKRWRAMACFAMLGCMRWSAAPVNVGLSAPATLRLHLRGGGTVIVRNAVVQPDSIIGAPWGGASAGARIAVARAQVERIDVGETDEEKTTWLAIGLVIVTVGGSAWLLVYAFRHARPS